MADTSPGVEFQRRVDEKAAITAARAQGERDGIEKAVQIALKYRDEAGAGQHADVGDSEHSLGQGYAANSIAKRIRALDRHRQKIILTTQAATEPAGHRKDRQ